MLGTAASFIECKDGDDISASVTKRGGEAIILAMLRLSQHPLIEQALETGKMGGFQGRKQKQRQTGKDPVWEWYHPS